MSLFREFSDKLPVNLYKKNRDFVFTYCNLHQANRFGLSKEEDVIGKTDYDFLSKEIAEKIRENDLEVFVSSKEKIAEEVIFNVDGSAITYLSYKIPEIDASGFIIGLYGMSIDISEYASKIKRSNEMLSTIIKSMPEHIYWKNEKGVFLGCNDQQAKSVGFSSYEELIGKTIYDTMPYEQADIIFKSDQEIIRTGKDKVLIEKSNEIGRGVEVYKSHKIPLKDKKNNTIGLLGVSLNITDKYNLEKELIEKNKELEFSAAEKEKTLEKLFQFVQDQEHDIRTPMTGLIGSAEILQLARDRGLDINSELVSGSIDDMVISGNELLSYQESVIFDLYGDISKGNTIFRRFDLKEIVERVFNLNRSSARSKSLDYSFNFDSDVPRYLKADGKKIYQCLVDVLSNAIRFTEDGTVSLSVQLIDKKDNKAIIRFLIKDTGIGIPEDLQHRIYEEYFKVKPSNKGGKHGRGLGLTRAFRYVNSVNGEIDFTSKIGEGTSFRVVLPLLISLDQSDS